MFGKKSPIPAKAVGGKLTRRKAGKHPGGHFEDEIVARSLDFGRLAQALKYVGNNTPRPANYLKNQNNVARLTILRRGDLPCGRQVAFLEVDSQMDVDALLVVSNAVANVLMIRVLKPDRHFTPYRGDSSATKSPSPKWHECPTKIGPLTGLSKVSRT